MREQAMCVFCRRILPGGTQPTRIVVELSSFHVPRQRRQRGLTLVNVE